MFVFGRFLLTAFLASALRKEFRTNADGEIACAHLSGRLPLALAGVVTYEGVSRAMLRTISVIEVVVAFQVSVLESTSKCDDDGPQRLALTLLH